MTKHSKYQFLMVFIAIALFSGARTASALELPVRIDRLTIEEGLTQSSVYAIEQMENGRLWIATGDGISIYDGTAITRLVNVPGDEDSISDNYIQSVMRASDGTVWIGTNGGGLNRYLPASNTVKRYTLATSFSSKDIYALAEANDGRIWIGTGNGAIMFDPASEDVQEFTADSTEQDYQVIAGKIRAITVMQNGDVWLGSASHGLSIYRATEGIVETYNSDNSTLSNNSINAITQTIDGDIWVGTEFGGLNRFGANEQFEPVGSSAANAIGDSDVTAILEDDAGLLWLGTWSNGIVVYNRANATFQHLKKSLVNQHTLSSNTIISLQKDSFGSIWAGSLDNGLNRIPAKGDVFRHFVHDPLLGTGPVASTIWSFAESANGDIWVGTKNGLSLFKTEENTFEPLNVGRSLIDDIGNADIRALAERDNELWIGTYGGLKRHNLNNGESRIYTKHSGADNGLSSDKVRLLMFDNDGMLWIGTQKGLNRLDPKTNRIRQFNYDPTDPYGLPHPRIRSLSLDRSGQVYVGTSAGFATYDPNNDRFITTSAENSGLTDNDVRAFYFDEAGQIWIGTQKGISIYDSRNDQWRSIRQHDGLANDTIYSMIDDGNHLWVTTNNGLSRLDSADGSIENFFYSDGLQSNEFNFNAAIKASDGTIYIGGINGFNAFRPQQLKLNNTMPLLEISRMDAARSTATQTGSDTDTQLYVMSNDRLDLELKAVHLASKDGNRIKYRLMGVDADWMLVKNGQATASYDNLSGLFIAKEYKFEARAISKAGIASAVSNRTIIASAPTWSRPPFLLLYALIIASLFYVFLRTNLHTRYLKKTIIDERQKANSIITQQKKAIAEQADHLQKLEKFKRQSSGYIALEKADRIFLSRLETVTAERIADERFSVAELASALNVGEQTLRRKIMILIKCTPQEYITNSKILAAQKMLLEGHKIKETAFAVGYTDQAHFSRVFKRITTQSPTEFKREASKD